MSFANNKKTFLSKSDKSKKGSIDVRVVPLLETINSLPMLFSTSSCSGRVYLWRGSGKKNETEWIRMSHDQIDVSFFEVANSELLGEDSENKSDGVKVVIWLRFESSIFHVCCESMGVANALLDLARKFYKKSSILGASNKIIVEIRAGDIIEMPFYVGSQCVFSGDRVWLVSLINSKMDLMWERMELFLKSLTADVFLGEGDFSAISKKWKMQGR